MYYEDNKKNLKLTNIAKHSHIETHVINYQTSQPFIIVVIN